MENNRKKSVAPPLQVSSQENDSAFPTLNAVSPQQHEGSATIHSIIPPPTPQYKVGDRSIISQDLLILRSHLEQQPNNCLFSQAWEKPLQSEV